MGDIDELLTEGRTIQGQTRHVISLKDHKEKASHVARTFAKLVFQGKIRATSRFLSKGDGGRILDLNAVADTASFGYRAGGSFPEPREVNTAVLIHIISGAAHNTSCHVRQDNRQEDKMSSLTCPGPGTAGPSDLDAAGWCRMFTSFGEELTNLQCHSRRGKETINRLCGSHRSASFPGMPGVRPIGGYLLSTLWGSHYGSRGD